MACLCAARPTKHRSALRDIAALHRRHGIRTTLSRGPRGALQRTSSRSRLQLVERPALHEFASFDDERYRDDDGPRGDHRDSDGIEELALVESVESVHDASVDKGHDRGAAAEHEGTGLGEIPSDAPQLAHSGTPTAALLRGPWSDSLASVQVDSRYGCTITRAPWRKERKVAGCSSSTRSRPSPITSASRSGVVFSALARSASKTPSTLFPRASRHTRI